MPQAQTRWTNESVRLLAGDEVTLTRFGGRVRTFES